MSTISREEVLALLKKQESKISKSAIADPNLRLFTNDEQRYKAYRWYCLKNIVLKVAAILAGATAIGGGIIEVFRSGFM